MAQILQQWTSIPHCINSNILWNHGVHVKSSYSLNNPPGSTPATSSQGFPAVLAVERLVEWFTKVFAQILVNNSYIIIFVEIKSKRFTSRHRAKVEKKVKEHQRKVRKEGKMTQHKKPRKDPGLPSMMPGKEEYVARMQQEREKEKIQRQALLAKNDLHALAQEAINRANEHRDDSDDTQEEVEVGGKFFDPSKRAFYREFQHVVQHADVILEVLDARDPMGCRVKAVEEMVASHGGSKRIVLILNKIDLVPKDVVKQWLAVLRRDFPAVAFKASTQSQRSHLGSNPSDSGEGALSSSECLGADTLIQLLKNYCRNLNIKTSIRVGVIGYPNVGKSSLINSLKRSKVCKVGATPGVTTSTQEIHLDKNIKLLDCPGIVFANPANKNELNELFLRNCVRIEQLEDPVAPINLIISKANVEQLMFLYCIPRFENSNEFLLHVAKRQGKLKKGGIPNIEAAARAVLHDWNQGKIPFYTLPPVSSAPTTTTATDAIVVNNWAPEFDLESLEKMEIEHVLIGLPDEMPEARPIETTPMEEIPQLVVARDVKPKQGKKASLPSNDYKFNISQAEAELNPQQNKNRNKALKQAKKIASKGKSTSNNMEVDDAYDFSTDFNMN